MNKAMVNRIAPLHASTVLALILISATCGWFVPAFYNWTGADQSRPSALMWQVPLAVAIGALLFCITLPWIPISGWTRIEPKVVSQFTLRSVLLLMAGVAVAIAIGMRAPLYVTSFFLVWALAAAVRTAILYPTRRLPIAALLACMILPFAWLLGYGGLGNLMPSVLWMAAGMPGFFLMAVVASLFGVSPGESGWLAILITTAQISIGLQFVRVGPKPAIAYILFLMLASLMGSLIFHAMVRA